jgi:uncharacterized membrane protein
MTNDADDTDDTHVADDTNETDDERLNEHVEQNVKAVGALRRRADDKAGSHQLFIERATEALGRPRTIYLVLLSVVAWGAWNLFAPRLGYAALDPPPFYWMQGVLALGSLMMTTMVLTAQNRQVRHADQRAHLDLQVNLLAEQKIAKVIALLEELRRDLPIVRNRQDLVAEAMTEAVKPDNVISALEEVERELAENKPR